MTDLANRPYIKFTTDIEKKPPNEDDDIQACADMINVIQKAQFNLHRHCYSGRNANIYLDCCNPTNMREAPMPERKA